MLKEKFDQIYDDAISHSSFLSKKSVDSCMHQAYMIGKEENQEQYDKLKKAFLELLELWGDYGNYNSARAHMEEDWKKEGGLL
jgi:hypothetical protein